MLEVHRHPLADCGLDLPDPPRRLLRMADELAGLERDGKRLTQ